MFVTLSLRWWYTSIAVVSPFDSEGRSFPELHSLHCQSGFGKCWSSDQEDLVRYRSSRSMDQCSPQSTCESLSAFTGSNGIARCQVRLCTPSSRYATLAIKDSGPLGDMARIDSRVGYRSLCRSRSRPILRYLDRSPRRHRIRSNGCESLSLDWGNFADGKIIVPMHLWLWDYADYRKGTIVQKSLWAFHAIMLLVGGFMTVGGAYAIIQLIIGQYATGAVGSAFSCANK